METESSSFPYAVVCNFGGLVGGDGFVCCGVDVMLGVVGWGVLDEMY